MAQKAIQLCLPELESSSTDSITETTSRYTKANQKERYYTFPSLELESRTAVCTNQAAYYLNRRPQTLRSWASRDGSGPIRPLRINGRLAWPVSELKRILGVA